LVFALGRQQAQKGDDPMMRELFYGISEQGKAGKHRMDDARALLNAVRWRGAMYMAGYSVECLLKTKLMRMFDCRHLRELEEELQRRRILPVQATIFTHQLELLVRLANGLERLRGDEEHWRLFNMVNRWVPAWRYTADQSTHHDAEDFLAAVDKISRWIENNI
jgi:HEPN domain-containing protein